MYYTTVQSSDRILVWLLSHSSLAGVVVMFTIQYYPDKRPILTAIWSVLPKNSRRIWNYIGSLSSKENTNCVLRINIQVAGSTLSMKFNGPW